jgi:mono/diheme cytochrome c family protein
MASNRGRKGHVFHVVGVALVLVVFSWVLAVADAPSGDVFKNPFDGNRESIAVGKTIFEAVCAGYCHATENTKRPGRCPNLFDCQWKYGKSDGEVFRSVTEGVPKTEMVGFKGRLPDEVLWKIIAYLRSASQCQEERPAAAAAH